MKKNLTSILTALLVLAAANLAGCANYLQPFNTTPAHPGLQSVKKSDLTALPAPQEKVVVAVYRFRDQTGQYKASEVGASWSTAVTQGATSILMRALEESGWFLPIEREGLSNLLNERQIIQSIRSQHTGPNGEPLGPLPPLLYAGVMLEGGIVGYDTNVITGGAGARYFGAGASGEFRQDQVTVYLRAVSTQTGRVLKTVHTTKTIISQKVDGGLFQFVDVKRLLETEAGFTYNEPPVLAVTEAIEEGVKNLIIEGVRDNLWALKNPQDANDDVFLAYDASVEDAAATDYFGRRTNQSKRSGLGIGAGFGALRYQGNYVNPQERPVTELSLRGNLTPSLGLGLTASAGKLAAERAFERSHLAGELDMTYYVLPKSRVTPFVSGGFGVLVQQDTEATMGDGLFPYVSASLGLEYMLVPRLALSVSFGNDYALAEGLDGLKMGSVNDNIWALKTGLTFYTGLF